jgi:lauroyl/myristoyl acyltransferase
VHELTRQIMRSLETTIRRYPEQWFIFRRLWEPGAATRARTSAIAEGA